jgi:deazaflavin-dependent oxidoreductase (nitroreductase family)
MADAQPDDWNTKIIEEFRSNDGKVGGPFEGAPMLLLHCMGAKTGQERVKPMVYRDLGDGRMAVFASKGGHPTNPDWYFNLVANPEATVEIGTETFPAKAHVADDAERTPIWEAQKQAMPGFADYEQKTTRQIPVIILERVG